MEVQGDRLCARISRLLKELVFLAPLHWHHFSTLEVAADTHFTFYFCLYEGAAHTRLSSRS